MDAATPNKPHRGRGAVSNRVSRFAEHQREPFDNMIILRLPRELKEIFSEWLTTHYPDRASKILNLLRQCRGGELNDPGFGSRMRGSGPIADLIGQPFVLAARRLGLGIPSENWKLTTSRFRITEQPGGQMTLPL